MKIVHVEEFQVAGIGSRTTNSREMSPGGVIPQQWAKAVLELDPVSTKFAVYTDYESDVNGEYTFVIGGKFISGHAVPEGMVLKTVPAGRYAVFASERGPVGKVVSETWQRIWSQVAERSYVADFEVYDQRAADPGNAVVDIYVGVK